LENINMSEALDALAEGEAEAVLEKQLKGSTWPAVPSHFLPPACNHALRSALPR
jgi:hypothetical protein